MIWRFVPCLGSFGIWYGSLYHVRELWYNGMEVCTMLWEFWYNGMEVCTMFEFWYNGICTMLGEVWYNGSEVCTMLGEFWYNGM